jgi:hypothetical protein
MCYGSLQSLRSRPACVGVATRLGWRLAWETRYTKNTARIHFCT